MTLKRTRLRCAGVPSAALLLASLLGACAGAGSSTLPWRGAPVPDPATDVIAFVGVTVLPLDRDTAMERQTVIVRGERIAWIGPTAEASVPLGATIVPGTGRFLMPGLVEMHAHIPPPQAGSQEIETTLFLYLAAGVTTVRGMLGDPMHLELRERAASGDLLSPRIYTSGPSLNGQTAPDPVTARRLVEKQAADGYDLIKLHPGLSREVFDTIAATAERVGIPFAGHVSVDVGVEHALAARQATIDHLDGYVDFLSRPPEEAAALPGFFGFNLTDWIVPERFATIVERTREAGVANVPTQTLAATFAGSVPIEELAARPEMRYMPRQTIAQWTASLEGFRAAESFDPVRGERFIQARKRLIRELHEAGAPILLGSDAPQIFNVPGFSALEELILLVEAGLTPYDALVAGTLAPAAHLGAAAEWGSIRSGLSADLILLDADPRADIRNVHRRSGVLVRGRWLPEPEIRDALQRIARLRAG